MKKLILAAPPLCLLALFLATFLAPAWADEAPASPASTVAPTTVPSAAPTTAPSAEAHPTQMIYTTAGPIYVRGTAYEHGGPEFVLDWYAGIMTITGEGAIGTPTGSDEYYTMGWNKEDIISLIKRVKVGEGITELGMLSFSSLPELSSLELPNSLERIDALAVYGCPKLSVIHLGPNVQYIESHAFSECTGVYEFTVDPANPYIKAVDGVLYSKDGATLVRYPVADAREVFAIPEGVTYVCDGAFAECQNLKEAQVPESLSFIPDGAFSECHSLLTVRLPRNLAVIGQSAFANSANLLAVRIPGSTSVICRGAFDFSGDVYFEGLVPPAVANAKAFGEDSSTKLTAHVPADALEDYEAAYAGMFADIIPDVSPADPAQPALEKMGGDAFHVPGGASWELDIRARTLRIYGEGPAGGDDSGSTTYTAPWQGVMPMVREVTVEEGVTELTYAAFDGDAVERVSLPSTLKAIAGSAFMQCELGSVCFHSEAPPAFEPINDYPGAVAYVPAGSIEAYRAAYGGVFAEYLPLEASSPPEVSAIRATDVTENGFDLAIDVKADRRVTRVAVGVYTAKDGADDIVWADAAPNMVIVFDYALQALYAAAGSSADDISRYDADVVVPYWTYGLHVDVGDHGGARGWYKAIVWVFDEDGLSSYAWADDVYVPNPADDEPPTIVSIEVARYTAEGCLLIATITDDAGVKWAPLGVYTAEGGPDDIVWTDAEPWETGVPEDSDLYGPDKYGVVVRASDHGGARGGNNPYRAILWAYDEAGHEVFAWGPEFVIPFDVTPQDAQSR